MRAKPKINDEKVRVDKWLTTQEAAGVMGFSLPYAAALFSSAEFEGKVQKVDGQLLVLYSSVRAWMWRNGVNFPLNAEDIAR